MQKYYCCACRKKVFAPFFRKITKSNIARWREALSSIIFPDCPFKIGSRLCSRHFERQDADTPTPVLQEYPDDREILETIKRRRITPPAHPPHRQVVEPPSPVEEIPPAAADESSSATDPENMNALVNWLEMPSSERLHRIESTSRAVIDSWTNTHSTEAPVCFECWLQEQDQLLAAVLDVQAQLQPLPNSKSEGLLATVEEVSFSAQNNNFLFSMRASSNKIPFD